MSSLRGPLGACWRSGRLPPPGKNESPALHGAFRCFRLVRRTLTVHERGEIGCQRGEQDNQEKADENLRYARLGFQEGVIATSNVLEAQTAWLSAQSEKIDAQIDVKLTEIYLQKSLGTLK